MKILITNDDSIRSPVLPTLVRWAEKLGEVVTVVPKYQQSGKSHSIALRDPFEVRQVALAPGLTACTVDSSPADCVRYAVLGMKEKFDLVISGINCGFNLGQDMIYSGTVAAIYEAAYLGIPAIALSTSLKSFDDAVAQLDPIWDFFTRHALLDKHNLYNVNVPLNPRGIRITRMGGPYFSDEFIHRGDGIYAPKGICVYEDRPGWEHDTDAAVHNYISISPLTLERTQLDVYNALCTLNPQEVTL